MNLILLGNIVFLFASVLATIIGLIKDKKKYLLWQIVVFVLMSLGNLLLKGYSGVIANVISIIRNIICIFFIYRNFHKYFFLIIQLVITIFFNTEGLLGYLPVVAVGIYTLLMDQNDQIKFKYVVILSQSFWIIYDIAIKNYVDIIFGISTIITNLYTAIKLKKQIN